VDLKYVQATEVDDALMEEFGTNEERAAAQRKKANVSLVFEGETVGVSVN
jgi:hypothetical protein